MKEEYVNEFLGKKVTTTIEYADYDPDKANDGGSYYQPFITAESGNDKLTIEDTSCGDFGARILVHLCKKDDPADSVAANYGSMVSDPYTEFSAHETRHMFWIVFAMEILNYHIPFTEEYKVNTTPFYLITTEDSHMKYYFVNHNVDPTTIYGNEYPVCLDEAEYNRLINQEGWTDLPELMHEANQDELDMFGYYDSTTGEIQYGTVYGNVSPWEN